MVYSEQFIQAFSRVFRHIHGYWYKFSHTHKHASRRERGGLPALFWKPKKCPDFGKEGPDCTHLWVRFSIQNVVLRVSRRKHSKIFSCRASFSCVFDEMFIEVPYFHKVPSSCPESRLVAHLHSSIILFAKRSILSVWQCTEYVTVSITAQ